MPRMTEASDRVVVVGIDEAGYGPVIGPLVVSAVAFEVPQELAGRCLWKALSKSVVARAGDRARRIVIQDSKKIYNRKEGLGALERSVLAVATAWRGLPATVGEYVSFVGPESGSAVAEYAWYRTDDLALPRAADAGSIRIASAVLSRNLAARDVRVVSMESEILPEGHFNRAVDATQNKAAMLFGVVLRLMRRVIAANPGCDLVFFVDKQGGRDYYSEVLSEAFPDRALRVLEQAGDEGEYELAGGGTTWRIRFSQEGDSKHMPVALASMMSKYARELFMERLNSYWKQFDESIAPTAGYYSDGWRFVKAISPHARRLGFPTEHFVRAR
ncbi:MAG TPA: hypothetical protein VNT79_02395 [Phycisphaerae bacterium]|nr:hypothetical protein [Phycisphaerae bacterium]